jgi:rod shape-determining protein MreD
VKVALRKPTFASFGFAGFVPIISTVVCSLLMLLPLGSVVTTAMMPHMVMISAFYWLSSRPLLLPFGACAGIGFFLDLWLGVPLGLNMAMLLCMRLFVITQLKHYRGRSRVLYWAIFSLLALVLYAAAWGVTSVVHGGLIPVEPVVSQWGITVIAYAPLALVLGRLRRLVM